MSFLRTTLHLLGPPSKQLLDFLFCARSVIAVFIGCLLGASRVLCLVCCSSGLSDASIVLLTLKALFQIRLLLVRINRFSCHSYRLFTLWKMQGDKEMDHVVKYAFPRTFFTKLCVDGTATILIEKRGSILVLINEVE